MMKRKDEKPAPDGANIENEQDGNFSHYSIIPIYILPQKPTDYKPKRR